MSGKKKNETEIIPYSDPYFHNFPSPYYKKHHFELSKKIRNWVNTNIIPYVNKWDENHKYPIELHKKAYLAGVYSCNFPRELESNQPEKWDYFSYLIFHDEIARSGCGGLVAGLWISLQIGLSPVILFGNSKQKKEVGIPCIKGEKIIALAVTEPSGGSDVSRIKTTAVLDPLDSNYYLINGSKYFITSGLRANYLTTAVKTGNSGNYHNDISMIIIDTSLPGVYRSKQKTQGWWCSNTAYITFKNVRVHKSNIIGAVNEGWKYIMFNFNHERFMMSVHSNRYSRLCLSESIKYGRERKTFGKRLIDHQVIRHKIADMIRKIETSHSLLESIAYLMNEKDKTSNNLSDKELSGLVAMGKVQCTQTMEYCAREAVQIFGGRGYLRGGRGSIVERMYREVRVNAIGGGSEEIMTDFAARQAKL